MTPGLYGASASEQVAACAVPDASAQPTTIASNPTKNRLTLGTVIKLFGDGSGAVLALSPDSRLRRAGRGTDRGRRGPA